MDSCGGARLSESSCLGRVVTGKHIIATCSLPTALAIHAGGRVRPTELLALARLAAEIHDPCKPDRLVQIAHRADEGIVHRRPAGARPMALVETTADTAMLACSPIRTCVPRSRPIYWVPISPPITDPKSSPCSR
jgi:hypothetical protein